MRITVNGEPLDPAPATHLGGLLQHLGLTGTRIAVELNQEIVSRSDYDTRHLKDGDSVEIVQAIGGG